MDLSPPIPLSSYAAFPGNLEIQNKRVVEALYYSIVLKGNISEFLGETHFSLGEVSIFRKIMRKHLRALRTALRYLKKTLRSSFDSVGDGQPATTMGQS
jgi:hypothetical protein